MAWHHSLCRGVSSCSACPILCCADTWKYLGICGTHERRNWYAGSSSHTATSCVTSVLLLSGACTRKFWQEGNVQLLTWQFQVKPSQTFCRWSVCKRRTTLCYIRTILIKNLCSLLFIWIYRLISSNDFFRVKLNDLNVRTNFVGTIPTLQYLRKRRYCSILPKEWHWREFRQIGWPKECTCCIDVYIGFTWPLNFLS